MDGTATPKLRLRNVFKYFTAPRTGQRTLAVSDVDLDVQAGEFICVVGPSGCGKSTVMNMIAGLETPSSGTIEADGMPITGPGADRGVMFQDYALFPWQSVQEIEEAVFLADRVVVMSRHPGRVRAVLTIDLPRPRDDAIRADPRFGHLAEEI